MMKEKVLKFTYKNFLFLIIILLVFHNFKFFFNIYDIYLTDYNKRLIRFHGYCSREGIGFISQMYKKYNIINNSEVLNFGDFPSSSSFFFSIKNLKEKKYVFVINADIKNFYNQNFYKNNHLIHLESFDKCHLFLKN